MRGASSWHPLEKEFGWKRADTSMVFTIAVVVFALTFIVAGRLQDKFGPFWVSLTGAILVSLGFFLCAFTHSLMYLFVCFGVIGGLGNGFGYSTPIPVMAKWFPDKRGLAVGLAVGGYGAGSALFGPLANLYLIPAYGVHTTFKILGGNFPGHDRDWGLPAEEPSRWLQTRGMDAPAPHGKDECDHAGIYPERGVEDTRRSISCGLLMRWGLLPV